MTIDSIVRGAGSYSSKRRGKSKENLQAFLKSLLADGNSLKDGRVTQSHK